MHTFGPSTVQYALIIYSPRLQARERTARQSPAAIAPRMHTVYSNRVRRWPLYDP